MSKRYCADVRWWLVLMAALFVCGVAAGGAR